MQKQQNQHATRYLETGTKCHTPTLRRRPNTWTPKERMPYVRRAPRCLNLQCTSLTLSVFAHSYMPFSFSNSVLAKLTSNTFTGMCPAVSCDFLAPPEILVSPHNCYNVAM